MGDQLSKKEKYPSLRLSLTVFAIVVAILGYGAIVLQTDLHMPLATAAIFVALLGRFFLGIPWGKLQARAISAITDAMEAVLIMMSVGILVGVWIMTGTVPGLIHYGLFILRPSIFPVASVLICSIVALATGSSWQASATVGIALMGIGSGLGIPPALTAGAVVSGAYFGDKMSPLSDSTNLAPAVSGASLFDHIRAMVWTTTPTYLLTLVIMTVLGLRFAGGELNYSRIQAIQALLNAEFPISLICLVPPLIIIGSAFFKIPALPGIFGGIGVAVVLAFIQGHGIGEVWDVAQYGYVAGFSSELAQASDPLVISELLGKAQIGYMDPVLIKEVADLLSSLVTRGGLQSMMWLISMMLTALTMGGILEACGFLSVIANAVIKRVHSVGGLVATTVLTAFLSNFFTGDQAMSAVIPGRMFKATYEKAGLAPRMLSRSLEDGGTITSPLIPWSTCGAYQSQVLGVATLSFLPFAVFNLLNPLMAVTMAYFGIGIYWREEDGTDVVKKKTALPELA